jgi:KUP system potassium uptake protein
LGRAATLVIIVVLFGVQKHGTSRVGMFFGPVMVLYFVVIAVLGVIEIAKEPAILRALNPIHALRFFANEPIAAFISLGAVVLAVTGTEALYADMGHFGRSPIRRAWLAFVLPALVLNYYGQGALLLADPAAVKNPSTCSPRRGR